MPDTIICPICQSTRNTPVSPGVFCCAQCGICFNTSYAPARYSEDYFIGEYRAQYGKTYIEDFPGIYAASQKRFAAIEKLLPAANTGELSLLEIGSALGFFLKAAQDAGVGKLLGIEISEFAASYCRKEFNIPVIAQPFDEAELDGSFDVIAAWYFIEHSADPLSVLRKIFDHLKKGGIFAFSAPSVFGPTFLLHRQTWFKTHPVDHRIDFSPASARKVLRGIGFSSVHVRPAGMHPERVVPRSSILYRPFSLLYAGFSRLTGFSDTIEVYAVR